MKYHQIKSFLYSSLGIFSLMVVNQDRPVKKLDILFQNILPISINFHLSSEDQDSEC